MRRPYYLAIALYCTFLFWMSHQSRPPGSQIDFEGADKMAHFIVYGILAALVSVGLHRAPKGNSALVRLHAPILFATLSGISVEIHQYFFPC
ncbi:MAG: VanZ family protein, partial [Candidatus Hydrogenedentes bacterium]|nr:VanZ family protein [Candidatus Hydrogenedentota bacterium]